MGRIVIVGIVLGALVVVAAVPDSWALDYYMRLKRVGTCWKCTTAVLPSGSPPPKARFMKRCTREQAIECQAMDGACDRDNYQQPIPVRIVPGVR